MPQMLTGGGSSAVAASTHAACERFRRTDPLVTTVTRRQLAAELGKPDVTAGIPEARWMRAMMFEAMVKNDRFVSRLLTTAVGRLDLPRPAGVRTRSAHGSPAETARELARAHAAAVVASEATMLTALGLPFFGMEDENATLVKPDFAIVCPRADGEPAGSWLIMGDAKDYERVRSRIDDGRLLKGFLQVAVGAESAATWRHLPAGMLVHPSGALAVPRNSFLQPEALVERLDDHRAEVRARAEERRQLLDEVGPGGVPADRRADWVAHVAGEFDPATCPTCSLFSYCREELRTSAAPEALLVEIGIDRAARPALRGLVDGTGVAGRAPAAAVATVTATVTGLPVRSARRRTDPVGLPGTVNVVLAKSDSAALGVYGIAVQRVTAAGPGPWVRAEFPEPQASETRRAIMGLLGAALREAMAANRAAAPALQDPDPVHLVVPDTYTADLLVAVADSLAGGEVSRLRWERDRAMGRTPRTFSGDEATIPAPLAADERLAVSFLLDEDRARAMTLRQPVVDLRAVLVTHVVAGGPASESGRLDYLLRWAEATERLDHRAVSDDIARQRHTPGARLSNAESDDIHAAQRGDEARYRSLVRAAVDYKIDVVDRALAVLAAMPVSRLRAAYRALEGDAQAVWRRRHALQASDLVRFSLTWPVWRNDLVTMLDADASCSAQLSALVDPDHALGRAEDPGMRELAIAEVVSTSPLRLAVASRRIGDGSRVVALHVNGAAVAEMPGTGLVVNQGTFKFQQMPIGLLVAEEGVEGLHWLQDRLPGLAVGDRLVVADTSWFAKVLDSGHEFTVTRPKTDTRSAPKPTCLPESYAEAPDSHRYCCRPHPVMEAETADRQAERRERGEMNPQAWPPVIDDDRFDVAAVDDVEVTVDPTSPPADATRDEFE
ncbi:hypothetical protein [Geodermatophilus sp. SYSU D00815]